MLTFSAIRPHALPDPISTKSAYQLHGERFGRLLVLKEHAIVDVASASMAPRPMSCPCRGVGVQEGVRSWPELLVR
jgi:hypothetical protein